MKKSDKAWDEFTEGGDLDAKTPKPEKDEDEKDDLKVLKKEDVFK